MPTRIRFRDETRLDPIPCDVVKVGRQTGGRYRVTVFLKYGETVYRGTVLYRSSDARWRPKTSAAA